MRHAFNYKEALRKSFSRCAHCYDKYANIQHFAAGELLKELPAEGIRSILEIGCGTGNYTLLLKNQFKAAKITAVDISGEMIAVARQKFGAAKINFVVADAEEMAIAERFDLITSNATFQWFEDIEENIARCKNALPNNGLLAFSIFGPLTFRELNESFKKALHEGMRIRASYFLTEEGLKNILGTHFRKISIRELLIEEEYTSLEELLNKIKYTGVRSNGANSRYFLGRRLLRKIEEIYKQRYGRIEATYQILFCKAIG